MLKKLDTQKLINYKKYQGTELTSKGRSMAIEIIRKHRLWEVFLVEKLDFKWDEVHDIAEELEHIESEELTNRLEDFLDNPKFDPHGDPIPNAKGVINKVEKELLSEANLNQMYTCVGVKDSSTDFLQYLDKQQIALGSTIKILEKEPFDETVLVEIDGKKLTISNKIATNLYIR
jgi:DtxR family Mn-dependent transcriptional regulator